MIKLGRLRIENFKSFKNPFEINFSTSGLFIFDGPNGFGKTTIFDAVEICMTGRIGRIVSTDTKQKRSHLLKNDSNKITTIFLELKEEEKTVAVICSYIPSHTSKDDNKPGNWTIKRQLLDAWPDSFEEISSLNVNNVFSLGAMLGNLEIESTYDLFNYVQQEETCHFLKNKESQRHEKINYLFGTAHHHNDRKKINNIKVILGKKLQSFNENILNLKSHKVELESRLSSELNNYETTDNISLSGKLSGLSNFQPDSVEKIQRYIEGIRQLVWVSQHNDEFKSLEFNHLLNVMTEQRELELKDLILAGHLKEFKQIEKLVKHIHWLNELDKKITKHKMLISLAIDEVSTKQVSELEVNYYSISIKYSSKLRKYYQLSEEIEGYQELLGKILKSRDELKKAYDAHVSDIHDESISIPCPFCGDDKSSAAELWIEYNKQAKMFEMLKSESLSDFEMVVHELQSNFISDCVEKSKRYLAKYEPFLKLKKSFEEQVISKSRFENMLKVKGWLQANNINFKKHVKANSDEFIGSQLSEKLFGLKSLLRDSTRVISSDVAFNSLKASMKSYDISFLNSKLVDRNDNEVLVEDLENDIKYLNLLNLKISSNNLKEVGLKIGRLEKIRDKLKVKERMARDIFNKYTSQIKLYEKSVAKQIAIPFYIYSSKILQTRPDGNGAFIQCAENAKENGFIRFLSNLKDDHDAWNTMSSGQLSGLVLSFMLAMNKVYPTNFKTLLIDDPVQTMDEINLTSFVQLLRYEFNDSQLLISTHERKTASFFAYKYQRQTSVEVINMKNKRLY